MIRQALHKYGTYTACPGTAMLIRNRHLGSVVWMFDAGTNPQGGRTP